MRSACHSTWLTLAACASQGLLLDCDAATLTVWFNGERKGVMVRPGMTNEDGQPVGRLEGPLRWAADVRDEASVAIAGPLPPPNSAAAGGAAAAGSEQAAMPEIS